MIHVPFPREKSQKITYSFPCHGLDGSTTIHKVEMGKTNLHVAFFINVGGPRPRADSKGYLGQSCRIFAILYFNVRWSRQCLEIPIRGL